MSIGTKNIILIPSNDINSLNQLSGTRTLLRCEESLKLWITNRFDLIVTSGSGSDIYDPKIQTLPAADLMKQWLVSKGIPEAKILSENRSLDTYTNIHFSLKLLEEKNIDFESLAVVSHWAHLARIRIILWRNYRIKPISIPVHYRLTLMEWLHEIGMFFFLMFDKSGYGLPGRLVRKFIRERIKRYKITQKI